MKELLNDIAKWSEGLDIKIMEVCGGHTNTIMRYGISELLPRNIELISGPGCPVCVTSQHDIDSAVALALSGVPLATYGDMVNVPGTEMSLASARERGADVQIIYSVDEIGKGRTLLGVGFETTTPMSAHALKAGVPLFSVHKVMPPPMRLIAKDMKIDGFIDPGHVATITGSDMWEELDLRVPQVISGFRPEQMIKALHTLIRMIHDGETGVRNEYPEAVTPKGNEAAQALTRETMEPCDSVWRGFGNIPHSGLRPKDEELDARIIHRDVISKVRSRENPACRCGEVVRGLIRPEECSLFGRSCTPGSPKGACMVSSEGACAIWFEVSSRG